MADQSLKESHSHRDGEAVLTLAGVGFAYPERPPVLREVSLALAAGEKLGLVGDNGSGKTTLLHLIMGLLRPAAGRIILFGRHMRTEADFAPLRGRIGLLFQDADDQLFCPTVLEDVAFGPLNQGKSPTQAVKIARQTLERLEIEALAERVAHQLSGGEKKMAALAAVLAMEPEVLLLDEPTAGLDFPARQRLLALLRELDLTMLLISHEYDFLAEVTKEILVLRDGVVIAEAAALHTHVHVHPAGSHPHRHLPQDEPCDQLRREARKGGLRLDNPAG